MTRTARRLGSTLAGVAVLAAGCGADPVEPRATPTVTATTARPAVAGGPVVAVIREAGDVEVFRMVAGRREARRVRTLPRPAAPAKAVEVTVSAGAAPTVCAVWALDATRSLRCYPADGGEGFSVATAPSVAPFFVALSHSGTSVAWVSGRSVDDSESYPDVYYARLEGAKVSEVTRVPASAENEARDEVAVFVTGLAWSGDDTLLVAHAADTDDNGSLAGVPLAAAARGWTHGTDVRPDDPHRPIVGGVVSSSDDSAVLAIQRGPGGSAERARAVLLDIRSRRILDVVATPLPDREVSAVTGGESGVLYQTQGFAGDLRTYWRHPGEQRGQPLGGLPADARTAVAQP